MATAEQVSEILSRRVSDVAQGMMEHGVFLTWEQADEIGDDGRDWLRSRLGLTMATGHDGVTYAPSPGGESDDGQEA
jgi:hypothetical protein